MISRFAANSEKCRKYTFLGGSAQIIKILQRGGSYLIFVIFFTLAKFLENKIYTEKRQFFALNL